MPNPNDWTTAPEEEVDYGEDEDLDTAEDDGLFSGEGPMQAPDFDSSSEKGYNEISMGENDIAEVHLSPKAPQPLFGKKDKKTGEIDNEDEEDLLQEILTKGVQYFEEHKVLDTKITKTEVALHIESKTNDGEDGSEAMDISDDSGHFEELDENGAEILGIEKDLQDIEAQEDKMQKHGTDSDRAEKALATFKKELRSPPKHHGAKFDPKDGPVVSCEMEFDRNLSPFGHVNFYPHEHELQAGFSDHANAKFRNENISSGDEEISPKNRSKFDSKHSGTAKLKWGRTTPPLKSHELPTDMPSQFPGSLPSPPPTEVDSDTRRNAIGASSYVPPSLSPESINKQASFEAAKDATGYLFDEKPSWYKERESFPLPKENPDINAVAPLNHYKKNSPFKPGAPGFQGWDQSAKTTKATSSWPPWMTAKEIKSLERKGVNGPSIASLQERWGTNVPTRVNMFSLPQGGDLSAASGMRGQCPSKALGTGSSQSIFGYETSDDPPKQPTTESDKHTRIHVTTHRLPAPNVDSTITASLAPQSRHAITLVRPARDRTVLFEQPYELERLLDQVRILYPVHPLTPEGRYDHLSFRLIKVNVGDHNRPLGFEQIASISDAYLDGGALQDHYQTEIMPRLMAITDDEHVWVVRTFTRLWVHDGRDTSNFFKLDLVFPLPQANLRRDPDYFFAQYDTTPDPPGCIKAQFDAGIVALMGGDVVNDANVQVDRYKKEWLEWRSRMDDGTFLRSFFWRIDDPTINVYPKNWNPHQSFEESEEEREARRRRRQQEAQDALNAARLLNNGPGLRMPTSPRQNYFNSGQFTEQFDDSERRRVAERDQELNRQEQLLAQWAIQLDTRDRQLGERTALFERTIRELQQQRQILNRVHETFETAHNETAERTVNINIQHQAFRNASTCKLNDGPKRCGRRVFGDYQGDLYALMVKHWREYHVPQSRCQLHALCHTILADLNDDEQREHALMHQEAGQVIQTTGPPRDRSRINKDPHTTGPPNGPATAPGVPAPGTGITPHPSGNPTGGPVVPANRIDPQSNLGPYASGTFWICRCGTNLNSFKNNPTGRGNHYAKCGYNDAHLRFRGSKTKTPEEIAKTDADALKKARSQKRKNPDPAGLDASDEEAGQSKKNKKNPDPHDYYDSA
ncbi:hypothetical protein MMC27_001164 [Xylographa pallens]|nr:hypothetical protein [Xylographa pallens]